MTQIWKTVILTRYRLKSWCASQCRYWSSTDKTNKFNYRKGNIIFVALNILQTWQRPLHATKYYNDPFVTWNYYV